MQKKKCEKEINNINNGKELVPVDSTNLPLELFFTTETRVRDRPWTRNMDNIAGVTAKSCKFTLKMREIKRKEMRNNKRRDEKMIKIKNRL